MMLSFGFESEIFRSALEFFERMEVEEYIYEGSVSPSKINSPGQMPTAPVLVIKGE